MEEENKIDSQHTSLVIGGIKKLLICAIITYQNSLYNGYTSKKVGGIAPTFSIRIILKL